MTAGATVLCGIHQLHYLPWLRYFEKIVRSDVFIILDTVQYNKNGWQNRNRIKSARGPVLLTVPVHAPLGCTLDAVRIDNTQPWRRKHWLTIEQSYRRAPQFARHSAFLRDTYARDWDSLNELNRHMLDYFVHALGIGTRVVYASELNVEGVATDRLVNLLKAVGADAYYSGAYALDQYLDAAKLERAGIELRLQQWRSAPYPQLHGAFVSDLSVVDLIMNLEADAARDILLRPETADVHDTA